MKFSITRNLSFSIKNYLLLLFFLLSLQTTTEASALLDSEWTILVFVQANNNLKSFAQHNFLDMASVGSNKNLNILVQCYFPQLNGTSRYKIEKGKMVLDAYLATGSDGTNPKDLVESMRWAVTKYPAKKYALILWNHGLGIIDPPWGNNNPYATSSQRFYIDPALLDSSPRIQISDLTIDTKQITTTSLSNTETTTYREQEIECLIDSQKIDSLVLENSLVRGILFNEKSKTYMTNQSLVNALKEIKVSILKNRKIDILGMDACLMAMIEICYQLRDFASYLIASEEAELAQGWNYGAVCNILNNQNCTPLQAAQSIVFAYELYYKNKVQFYTQSAIDLKNIEIIRKSIDDIVYNIKACQKISKPTINGIIKKTRSACLQFSTTSYIDLHSFCNEFFKQINSINPNQFSNQRDFVNLKLSLQQMLNLIEQTVIAYVTGTRLSQARGLSIYFPHSNLENSYFETDFGKNCAWASFILDYIKNK